MVWNCLHVRPAPDNSAVADVAVISVVASGTVGILGAASGFYGQRVTLHNEREQRQEGRRDDLRAVLDEAAEGAIAFFRPFYW